MPVDREFYIAGAGGAGREALDIALAHGRAVTGFLDDALAGTLVRGIEVLAPEDAPSGGEYVVAIAAPEVRHRLALLLDAAGLRATRLIHPRAVIGPHTTLGPGFLVHANTLISSDVTIATHCQVHYNATVGHDCVLADRVTVYPGANVAGNARLGTGVAVGSGAVILQGLTIGACASVGAGAVVTRNVQPYTVVVGSPARPMTGYRQARR
ncbi:MAG: NeuD/PglB/VioB family sugar acetyltransferase [Kibdelosporangium sp.]